MLKKFLSKEKTEIFFCSSGLLSFDEKLVVIMARGSDILLVQRPNMNFNQKEYRICYACQLANTTDFL